MSAHTKSSGWSVLMLRISLRGDNIDDEISAAFDLSESHVPRVISKVSSEHI